MSKRTNTAVWQEAYSRWRVAVQKDGQRRYFYSSTPGRTGQREANRKADAWLEDGIGAKVGRVEDVYKLWIEGLKQTTSASPPVPRDVGRSKPRICMREYNHLARACPGKALYLP